MARTLTTADIEVMESLQDLTYYEAAKEVLVWLGGPDKRRRKLAGWMFQPLGDQAGAVIAGTLLRCPPSPEWHLIVIKAIERLDLPPTPQLKLVLKALSMSKSPEASSRATALAARLGQTKDVPQTPPTAPSSPNAVRHAETRGGAGYNGPGRVRPGGEPQDRPTDGPGSLPGGTDAAAGL